LSEKKPKEIIMEMNGTVYKFVDQEMTVYTSTDGLFTMVREYNSESPEGMPFTGQWVLRDWNDEIVDFDIDLDVMIARNGIEVTSMSEISEN